MDIVFIANAWTAGLQNPTSKHQLARELAHQGHRVLWLDGAGMRRPSLSASGDRGTIRRKMAGALRGNRQVANRIWNCSPLILPMPDLAPVRAFNEFIYRWMACFYSRRLGFRRPALVNFLPTIPGVLRAWKATTVYYCVDRWDQFSTYDAALMLKLDASCCRGADLVVASSRDLHTRCMQHNEHTHLMLHGVDWQHFNSQRSGCPTDMPPGPVAGFFGLLSEWVDQTLLLKLADAMTGDERVVLMGKADVDLQKIQKQERVVWLGPKAYRDLPAYVQAFSVGMIPFVMNELTRAVNPIKLREMLAAGVPVVSTGLPEVEAMVSPGCRPAVQVAYDHEAFIQQVLCWLRHPPDQAERQRMADTVQEDTWYNKAKQLTEWIDGARISRSGKPSSS